VPTLAVPVVTASRRLEPTAAFGALPPAIILGGYAGSAISVARSLGRSGVRVYLLARADSPEKYSRYIRIVPLPDEDPPTEVWTRYLLGPASEPLRGAVVLACSDAGIEVLLRHREELAEKFVLDISNPEAQRCALNKLSTYRRAAEAGIATPRFWEADSIETVVARRDEYVYPMMVKPLYSHQFSAVFGKKYLPARDYDELVRAFRAVNARDLEALLLERIPGPDDAACSYYTYLDEAGTPQFDFTKRVIRRHPENEGLACYHITDWIPEARDLGRRLFAHIGLLGVGQVELKRDHRDGKLKVIEINARFTAANGLLAESGFDLGLFVYNRLVGRPQAPLEGKAFRRGLRLWYPQNDARAFLELRAKGRLGLVPWITGLLHPQVFPYLRWYDPAPSLVLIVQLAKRVWRRGARRLAARRPAESRRSK
jgi:D-aspartate ligase